MATGERPIRIHEKGGVTLYYPSTRTEVFIPGAELAAGYESKGGMSLISDTVKWEPPPKCDPKHIAFDAWNGRIKGLSGQNHDKELGDLNLWLTDTWAPDGPWYINLPHLADEGKAHILFQIPDMCAPKNEDKFRSVLITCKAFLMEGKSVHISCIGGHGRTGMVMACLLGNSGVKQPITFMRERGCSKWVESKAQIEFVSKFTGEIQDAKERSFLSGGYAYGKGNTQGNQNDGYGYNYWADRDHGPRGGWHL